ncbi:hypothetical protein [Bacillus sp. UNC438CL73TsuS30]|uniref:hypothetical protein n=1 Tax=Bacillus sp. UNC438CL73TsuS30 TaxID=1340434 RepID=UPI00047A4447|nr:hypothetical protein [Bacillus sp. UNC438CL73TsuS30]
MGTKQHFSITIKTVAFEAGRSYGMGANIYRTSLPSVLIKVGSLYIYEKTRLQATKQGIAQLLREIPENSTVSLTGEFIGTHAYLLSYSPIKDVIEEKRLKVYASNSPLKRDNKELYALAKDAQKRKESILSEI